MAKKNNSDARRRGSQTLRALVESLEGRTFLSVTTADVPLVTSFGAPIGGSTAFDLSKLSVNTFSSGYPKIRFNDDGDASAEPNEWYVATAFNRKDYLSAGWNNGTTGVYSYGSDTYLDAHPGEDWNRNAGGDSEINEGQQAIAVANGVVLFKGTGYGTTVILAHKLASGEIITSFYGHLASSSLTEGAQVSKGSSVGPIGKTGGQTHGHLHFEIRKQSMISLSNSVITLRYSAGMWPAASQQVNGDGGSAFIANNYYDPSPFLKAYAPTSLTTLQNNVAVTNLSGAIGSEKVFKLTVPSGASNLKFQISGGTGDADLYVKYGSQPTTSSWDYRPYLGGNSETVTPPTATPGDWYVMIRGYAAYTGVSLTSSYSVSAPIPAGPSNLTATAASTNQINLSWSDNSNNESGFRIERKAGSGGAWGEIATTSANFTGFQDAGLSAGTTYYYRVRAYNNSGNSGYSNESNATTQTASTITTLQNNVAVTNLSGAQASEKIFKLVVPSDVSNLKFQILGGTGDADIYVKFGSQPTTSSYDYFLDQGGNNETIGPPSATAGTWYVMVRGWSSYSGVSLTGSYSTGSAVTTLQNNVPVSNLSGAQASEKIFKITVPSGASNLKFEIFGGSGDADIYVKFGSAPTTSSYDYWLDQGGNNEVIAPPSATAGTWYVMVRGWSSFSGVSLKASYTI